MKKSKALQATTLRSILITSVIVGFALASGAFYFGFTILESYANEVNATVGKSGSSGLGLGSLNGLQNDLSKRTDVTKAVGDFFSSSANYQTKAIKDVYAYAAASDMTANISDVTLASAAATPGSTTPAATTVPSQSVTVTLTGSVSYTNLIKFLTYIQQSTPKMAVGGVEITRSPTEKGIVAVPSIKVEVFIK